MKTRIIILSFLAITAGFHLSCSSPVKKEAAKSTISPMPAQNNLPPLKLRNLDGTPLSTQSFLGSKTILVLFQPDCDHCQNEAEQIAKRLPAFAGYTVYFISSAPLAEVEKFSRDYKLNGHPNIHFALTNSQSIIDSYGPIPAPSIYIYSTEGTLLNSFNGEMEIDVVIKYL
jgi:peroxiredoxin